MVIFDMSNMEKYHHMIGRYKTAFQFCCAADNCYLDAVVRSYLQTKGELGQSNYNVDGFGQ